ncbi:hypothetical protein CR513_14392, partial [Mucuna pruriens]
MDMAPDHFQLQNMAKKGKETFKETTYQPSLSTPQANPLDNESRGRNNPTRTFTSILMSHTKLLTRLVQNGLVIPFLLKPLQPPYPKSYDQNAKYDYHANTISHATKNCWGLKHKVQDMIDAE